MIIIKEKDFEMVQTSGSFFDLSLISFVNKGKDNERQEMKLVAHGLPFEECIKQIVGSYIEDKTYTVKEYIKEYETAVNKVMSCIKHEDKVKKKITKDEN